MAITSFETRVRHITRHQTAELPLCGLLIERENSDAQCQPVCLYPRLDRDWIRSMGGLARQCACFPLDKSGDLTVQTNGEREGTAYGGVCRLHLRVPLNGQQTESLAPRGVGQPLDGFRPASQMTPDLFAGHT